MIFRAYLVKSNGDIVYGKSYEPGCETEIPLIPVHVRACVTLFQSSNSTLLERPYTLDNNSERWAYMFFESFALVLLTSPDADLPRLNSLMLPLGKAIAMSYGAIIGSWTGNIGEFADLDPLFKRYIDVDMSQPSDKIMHKIEKLVDTALEDPDIAYVGIIDTSGKMLHGNIPESLLLEIRKEMQEDGIKPDLGVVPKRLQIREYALQLFRVNSLLVAVASSEDGSRMAAVKVAGDIAHSLSKVLEHPSKSAK